ncbi:hypothetical protein L6452_00263 [Arctium lappa]|uniref:Uncharacterized protein n=1 Tax=Arctium lappa TaxID=4217 RepID=A0ACB9FCV4_ARCLA|nr:hypothetical protein L6452_00263 [Arctium lappa]
MSIENYISPCIDSSRVEILVPVDGKTLLGFELLVLYLLVVFRHAESVLQGDGFGEISVVTLIRKLRAHLMLMYVGSRESCLMSGG